MQASALIPTAPRPNLILLNQLLTLPHHERMFSRYISFLVSPNLRASPNLSSHLAPTPPSPFLLCSPATCASNAGRCPPKDIAGQGIAARYVSNSASEPSWLMKTISIPLPRERRVLYAEEIRGVVCRQAGHHAAEK